MRRPLQSHRTFHGEQSAADPVAVNDFRPKSMFEEYRALTIVFGIVALALAVYFVISVMKAPKPAPPPVQSVYIEALPQKAPPAPQ
jgi:hypothetical protein